MEPHEPIDLARIPSMTSLLNEVDRHSSLAAQPRERVANALRDELTRLRTHAANGCLDNNDLAPQSILDRAAVRLDRANAQRLRPVINATGILLHTGLGRSVLAPQAVARLTEIASGYANLEIDLVTGKRGQRGTYAESILRELTGAEAALIVNNNAAATLLALCELAGGREVIVSRGQLIEIGGSYRLPDVMQAGGARLREVGTTNKTHLRDYERAITDATALLMRVHTSNYRIVGFTAAPDARELAELAHAHGLLMYDDLGSGALYDSSTWTEAGEPTVADSLRSGADLVSFSGDKLLGGPQAGILLGRRDVIDRLRNNPMARALRVDKLTLAALDATLECYLDAATARRTIPILAALDQSAEMLRSRAKRLAAAFEGAANIAAITIVEEQSFAGGGSLPAWPMPTFCVRCEPVAGPSADAIATILRTGEPSVLCRLRDGALLFDVRTIRDDDVDATSKAWASAARMTQC